MIHNNEARVHVEVGANATCNHQRGTPQRRWPRPAKRPKGEEAKGQPSHIGRAVRSRIACFTDNLSQHIINKMRLTQTKSNDIELLFVSKWSMPANWFSNSVSAVVYVEDLCRKNKGWNDEIAFGVMLKEKFLLFWSRMIFLRHELFWFCLVQVSTTHFCRFTPAFMANARPFDAEHENVPYSS